MCVINNAWCDECPRFWPAKVKPCKLDHCSEPIIDIIPDQLCPKHQQAQDNQRRSYVESAVGNSTSDKPRTYHITLEQYDGLTQTIDTLCAEVAKLREEKEKLVNDQERIISRAKELYADLKKTQAMLAESSRTVENFRRTTDVILTAADRQRASAQSISMQLQGFWAAERADLQARLAKAESELEASTEARENAEQALQGIKAAAKDTARKMKDLESEHASLKQRLDDQQEEHDGEDNKATIVDEESMASQECKDDASTFNPMPSEEWLAAHRRRIRREFAYHLFGLRSTL